MLSEQNGDSVKQADGQTGPWKLNVQSAPTPEVESMRGKTILIPNFIVVNAHLKNLRYCKVLSGLYIFKNVFSVFFFFIIVIGLYCFFDLEINLFAYVLNILFLSMLYMVINYILKYYLSNYCS